MKKKEMLMSFSKWDFFKDLKNFNYLNFLKDWRTFFTEDFLNKNSHMEYNIPFPELSEPGLIPQELEEELDLVRIKVKNIDIYIRTIDFAPESNCQYIYWISLQL